MSEIITVGLDLAKNVFQVHGADSAGRAILRKKLRRAQVLEFFGQLPPCVVAMEACGGAHYWGREIGKLGHEVQLIPPAYVKPFVKRQKNDAADAEAICEAALLVPQGAANASKLIAIVNDPESGLPAEATATLQGLIGTLAQLEAQIAELDARIARCAKENDVARRLMTVPGIGPLIAHTLRRREPRPGDVWHLDEVVVKIAGRSFWLWRAVDQHGVVLEEILQSKRDKRAAKRLLVKVMKRWGFVPKRIITDKLRSYGAAKREVAPGLEHWAHKGLNNRAENSHLPFRKRERVMQGFRSPGGLQRFVSIHSATRNSFSVPARRSAALTIRYHRLEAFDAWKDAANVA